MDILDKAREIVNQRAAAYGDPTRFCHALATEWSTIFDASIEAEQMALAMISLKVHRAAFMLNQEVVPDSLNDTILDIIGYAYILSVIHDGRS